jgi:hypothetical protein
MDQPHQTQSLIGLGGDLPHSSAGPRRKPCRRCRRHSRANVTRLSVTCFTSMKIDAAAALGFKKAGGSFDLQAQQAATGPRDEQTATPRRRSTRRTVSTPPGNLNAIVEGRSRLPQRSPAPDPYGFRMRSCRARSIRRLSVPLLLVSGCRRSSLSFRLSRLGSRRAR